MSHWEPPKARLLTVRDTEVQFASDRLADERFERIGDAHYNLNMPTLSTDLDVNHVQYEGRACWALLTVHCGLPGVQATNGVLFHASVNLANIRDRETIARALQARTAKARIELSQWLAAVDELSVRVYQAEQSGLPAVRLSDVNAPPADTEWLWACGFRLPKRHLAMVFGDGDTLKTYTADAVAVALARQGLPVGIVDWEMTDEDHRARVARLDTRQMDQIVYLPCSRPLIHETDRIATMVHEHGLQYLIFDSVAFACHDKPEASHTAMAYCRAARSFGVSSFHIAHISKSGDQSDQKPFGSAFWHNSMRATWFAKRAESGVDPKVTEVGFYNRKYNTGERLPTFALRFTFEDAITTVEQTELAAVESLAAELPLRERIRHLLKNGSLTTAEIAEELGVKPNSVRQTLLRAKSAFSTIEGPGDTRYGLPNFRRVK